MEQFTILLRGVAIATVNGEIVHNRLGGDLLPLPAFEAVRSVVADATRSYSNCGFLPGGGAITGGISEEGARAGAAADAALKALCNECELRDSQGQLVPTSYLGIIGGRSPDDVLLIHAAFDRVSSMVPAPLSRRPTHDGDHEPPAG
jgi:hypothetical protein